MKERKTKDLDLQLNARGFESFAATGWLGDRPSRVSEATNRKQGKREEDKRDTTIKLLPEFPPFVLGK